MDFEGSFSTPTGYIFSEEGCDEQEKQDSKENKDQIRKNSREELKNTHIDLMFLHYDILDTYPEIESSGNLQIKYLYNKLLCKLPKNLTVNDLIKYLTDKYNNTISQSNKYITITLLLYHVGVTLSRNNDLNEANSQNIISNIEDNWNKYINAVIERSSED